MCPFYACFLVYFLSFCTKEWTRGRRVMDQPITPHVDLDPQPPIPLVVVYGAFPINSEDEKNGKPEAANMVFQVFLYPITFLCPSINFLSPKKKPFRLCKNHFISLKICQQQILPNCRQLRATTTSSPFVLHSDIHDNVLVDSFESRYARNPCLFPSPNGSHSSAESN